MNYFEAVVLGVIEGLTEFLPVSSTGHLTIAEKMMGMEIDDPGVTAYTAVIQMGAIAAVIVYFAKDIWSIASGWFKGLAKPELRGSLDYRMGWYVLAGSIPIGLVGLIARDVITGPLRTLWWVGGALIAFSFVMILAERLGKQERDVKQLTMRDAALMGAAQCLALIPGVSRSGATISAGLLLGLDRVTATRLSFLFSIPALLAAGLFSLRDIPGSGIGPGVAIIGILTAFGVGYVAIAWLLKFVSGHSLVAFVPYRIVLGTVVLALLGFGVMSAT